MIITVEVTQADIDAANADPEKRGYSNHCPIWQAIQRHPELQGLDVGADFLYRTHRYEIKLPPEAAKFSQNVWAAFVDKNDELWVTLKPFTFQLEV